MVADSEPDRVFIPAIEDAPEPAGDPENAGEQSSIHATLCAALRERRPPAG